MFEAKVSPFNTQIVLTISRSGTYEIYARFNALALNPYPLIFQVYSTVPDPTKMNILNFQSLNHQICGKDMIFRVTLRDKSSDPLTSTSVIIKSRLESSQNQQLRFEAWKIVEVATAVYEVHIITKVKGNYKLVVEVQSATNSNNYLPIQGSPYSVYWESAEASNTLTTIDGTGAMKVYTSGIETINLNIRDEYGNLFNYTYWQDSYVQNPVYIIQLIGDGTPFQIQETGQYPDIGLFLFQYISKLQYISLVLSVQIYTFKGGIGSYHHIIGSPFPLLIIQRNEDFYCQQIDLLFVGYGFTENTIIKQMPNQVVAGVLFETQVEPQNVFQAKYIETKDPLSDLFLLDFIKEDQGCICNTSFSKYCKNFSGDYEACSANKQCKWTYAYDQNAGGSLTNCMPCLEQEKCMSDSSQILSENTSVQTNDSSFYYLQKKIQQKGTFKAQLNVWTQSGLQMLIFQKPQFFSLVKQQRAYNFTHLKFDQQLNEIFYKNEDWSVAFLGKVKYSAICDTFIYNKANIPKQNSSIAVTYTITTNIQFEAFANGQLVAYQQVKQQTVSAPKTKNQFTIDLLSNQFFDFELYLQQDSLQNEQRINKEQNYYLEIYVETFNSKKRVILPNELFMLSTVSNTLIPRIHVVPAASNAIMSNVDENQGNWIASCIGNPTKRALFQINNAHIQVRDEFKNQKLLQDGENLILKIYQGTKTARNEGIGNWHHTTFYRQETLTKVLENLDYVHSTQLTAAFYIYELKFEINGVSLPQTCRVSLINGPVDVTQSDALLIQQDRYFGYDECIFAQELTYLLLKLKDAYGNAIPLDDGAAYHDLFNFQFEKGSEFSNKDCKQYGPIQQLEQNQIICRIRPAKADQQQLVGLDVSQRAFKGFPKSVKVLPSVHKRLLPGDLRIQRQSLQVTVSFKTVDAYGNRINSLSAPCNYFTHERLIYFLRVIDLNGQTQPSTQDASYNSLFMELSFQIGYNSPDLYLELMVLDGLLLENGISLKFFTEDNFMLPLTQDPQHLDQTKRPLYVENIQQSIFSSSSKYWHIMHQNYDRFSMRAACLVKPKFSEIYYFMSSVQSRSGANRITGFELWIGETLVIGEGKKQGQIQLQNNIWYAITIHYRVSNNIDPLAPQLLIQWQSAQQQVSTIDAFSGQVIALDIWEQVKTKKAVVYNDIISL